MVEEKSKRDKTGRKEMVAAQRELNRGVSRMFGSRQIKVKVGVRKRRRSPGRTHGRKTAGRGSF